MALQNAEEYKAAQSLINHYNKQSLLPLHKNSWEFKSKKLNEVIERYLIVDYSFYFD